MRKEETDGEATRPTITDVVFVLATPTLESPGVGYEVHRVGDSSCVLAYTSQDELIECCGEFQPWAAMSLAGVVADVHAKGLAGPVLNLPLDDASRWSENGAPAGADFSARVP